MTPPVRDLANGGMKLINARNNQKKKKKLDRVWLRVTLRQPELAFLGKADKSL